MHVQSSQSTSIYISIDKLPDPLRRLCLHFVQSHLHKFGYTSVPEWWLADGVRVFPQLSAAATDLANGLHVCGHVTGISRP